MLDVQFTETGLKELNYAIVSGKPKKGSDPEIKGLFLGVKSIEQEEKGLPTELFLWIYNNNTVFILNLKYYTISSIEVCIHEFTKKSQTINFKDSDHCSAIAKLHQIQNALGKQKRTRKDGLIEVTTYKNLPEYLAKMAPKTDKTKDSSNSNSIHTPCRRTYSNKNGRWENEDGDPYDYGDGYYSDNYQSKEVETSMFKRTSRYSAEEALANMKAKIEKIRSGEYKPIKLKKIPVDDIKKEEKKEAANNTTSEKDPYTGLYGGLG